MPMPLTLLQEEITGCQRIHDEERPAEITGASSTTRTRQNDGASVQHIDVDAVSGSTGGPHRRTIFALDCALRV